MSVLLDQHRVESNPVVPAALWPARTHTQSKLKETIGRPHEMSYATV